MTLFTFLSAAFNWRDRTGRIGFAAAFFLCVAAFAFWLTLPRLGTDRIWCAPVCAVSVLLLFGHCRRRLNDHGWSGHWMWLMAVSPLNLILSLVLMTRRPAREDQILHVGAWGKRLVYVFAVLVASRGYWAPCWIPSGASAFRWGPCTRDTTMERARARRCAGLSPSGARCGFCRPSDWLAQG
jgi:hypothetical protein